MGVLLEPQKPLIVFLGSGGAAGAFVAASMFARTVGDRLRVVWVAQNGAGVVEGVCAEALSEVGAPLLAPADAMGASESLMRADFLVVLGSESNEVIPGRRSVHWPVDGPEDPDAASARAFRNDVQGRVQDLVMDLLPGHYADAQ